jgi:hypothetical protein
MRRRRSRAPAVEPFPAAGMANVMQSPLRLRKRLPPPESQCRGIYAWRGWRGLGHEMLERGCAVTTFFGPGTAATHPQCGVSGQFQNQSEWWPHLRSDGCGPEEDGWRKKAGPRRDLGRNPLAFGAILPRSLGHPREDHVVTRTGGRAPHSAASWFPRLCRRRRPKCPG